MKPKYWWLKRRDNGQTLPYWSTLGNISQTEAEKHKESLCGYNYVHRFNSKSEYEARIAELKHLGERFV